MTDTYRMLASEVIITSANNLIRFRQNNVASDVTATIPVGSYYWDGTGGADDLLEVMKTAINAVAADTYLENFVYAKDGGIFIRILTDGTNYCFNFTTSTFPLAALGFNVASDLVFAVGHTAQVSTGGTVTWAPSKITTLLEPRRLSNDGAYHYKRADGSSVAGRTQVPVRIWPCQWDIVADGESLEMYELSELSFERWYQYVNDGRRIRICHSTDLLTSGVATITKIATGRMTQAARSEMEIERDTPIPTFTIDTEIVEDMTL